MHKVYIITSSQLLFTKLPDKFVKLNIHHREIFNFSRHKLDTPVGKMLNKNDINNISYYAIIYSL